MIVFVFVVVVAVAVGVVAFAMRGRAERGIESGIDSFRRELDALAPRGDSAPKRPDPTPIVTRDDDDEVRTVQIGERPPPRRPTPKVEPTGVAAPSTGDAPPEDDETADDEVTPPPVDDEADDGT